jgi:hypothetical protein
MEIPQNALSGGGFAQRRIYNKYPPAWDDDWLCKNQI